MIKKYNKFLEEFNIREDEHAHLNGKLDSNSDKDPTFDYLNDGDDHNDEVGDMEHLLNLLKTMFKNSGVETEVEYKNMDITIYCIMQKKETLKSVINVFEVANKLKRDILPQYQSEVVMYETKGGEPMIGLHFMYSDEMDKPF